MKIKFIFAWYDAWVGFFWDAKKRRLYFFPVPMFGCYIHIPVSKDYQFYFTKSKAAAMEVGRRVILGQREDYEKTRH